jgi:hypothetical protein
MLVRVMGSSCCLPLPTGQTAVVGRPKDSIRITLIIVKSRVVLNYAEASQSSFFVSRAFLQLQLSQALRKLRRTNYQLSIGRTHAGVNLTGKSKLPPLLTAGHSLLWILNPDTNIHKNNNICNDAFI